MWLCGFIHSVRSLFASSENRNPIWAKHQDRGKAYFFPVSKKPHGTKKVKSLTSCRAVSISSTRSLNDIPFLPVSHISLMLVWNAPRYFLVLLAFTWEGRKGTLIYSAPSVLNWNIYIAMVAHKRTHCNEVEKRRSAAIHTSMRCLETEVSSFILFSEASSPREWTSYQMSMTRSKSCPTSLGTCAFQKWHGGWGIKPHTSLDFRKNLWTGICVCCAGNGDIIVATEQRKCKRKVWRPALMPCCPMFVELRINTFIEYHT